MPFVRCAHLVTMPVWIVPWVFACSTTWLLPPKHAIDAYRLDRVLIVDFDVHHGNGTENAFANNPKVLMCSIFQSPLYPFSGGLDGADNMVNCPILPGSGREEIRQAMQTHWVDAIDRFKPQLVLVSAGFDAHENDPLADLQLTTEDYGWITGFLRRVAEEYCDGKLVSTLEGGYELECPWLNQCMPTWRRLLHHVEPYPCTVF